MKPALVVIALWTGLLLSAAQQYPIIDGDLSWQRWLGNTILQHGMIPRQLGHETFTDQGAPWVAHEWLFSIFVASFGGNRWPVFAGGIAIVAATALVLCALRASRRGASPFAIAVAIALTAMTMTEAFGIRVQVLAWALVAGYLLLLESESAWSYGAIAVAALWSNIHGSAVLAPILAAAWLAGSFLDEGWTTSTKRVFVITLGSIAAICINPFGVGLPAYAIRLVDSPFKDLIAEWRPTSLSDPAFALGALPILLIVCVFGLERWRDRLVFVTAGALLFEATRNIGMFALIAMPSMATAFSRNLHIRLPDSVRFRRFQELLSTRLVTTAFAIAALVVGVAISTQPQNTNTRLSDVIDVLHHRAEPTRVFCSDYAVCSLVFTATEDQVFLDSRADPYSDTTWSNYRKIISLDPSWSRLLATYDVSTIVVGSSDALKVALELSSGWTNVYRNENYEIWTRVRE